MRQHARRKAEHANSQFDRRLRHRRALLIAALSFVQLPPQTSALRVLHAWLDNWRASAWSSTGCGGRVTACACARSTPGARASQSPMVSDDGFASAPTPWARGRGA
jgi:hypothetical protein